MKSFSLDYFRSDANPNRLNWPKPVRFANALGPIVIFFLDLLITDTNGDLPFLGFNLSNVIRIAVCCAGIILNFFFFGSGKTRVGAAFAMALYAVLGVYFWYAFVVRHGHAIGFWIL